MTAPLEGLKGYRVLFQYFNPGDAGPYFGFTTVTAPNEGVAEATLLEARSRDKNFSIVQTVEANLVVTGFTYADVKAQATPEEQKLEALREGVNQIISLAGHELAGTGHYGTGYVRLIEEQWKPDAMQLLVANGLIEEPGEADAE